jgi:hypothetical protein
MAGQGYKLFVNGNTLSATDLNTYIQQQTVMVFADSTARTTALSGVVSAGMISYLTGTNSLETYNGSAWVANGVGDVTLTGTQTLTNKTLTLPAIDNILLGYATTATAAGTTTLTNASVNQQLFTGTTTQTVVMPVSSTMTVGTRYMIENNSTGVVTVQSSGLNTIVAIPSNTSIKITAILNSGTTAASWDYEFIGFNAITGTGSAVLGTSATLTTPTLASSTLTGTLTANGSAGTNGNYLQTTGTGVQWAAIAGGGMTLISTTTLSGTTTLSSIPQTYNELFLVVQSPSISAAGLLYIRPNGGSGQIEMVGMLGKQFSTTPVTYAAENLNFFPLAANTTVDGGGDAAFSCTMPNYTSTGRKLFYSNGTYKATSGEACANMHTGGSEWNTAITSIDIYTSAGSLNGGTAYLYGVK